MKTIKWTLILVSSLASVSGFATTNKVTVAPGITCGAQVYKEYANAPGGAKSEKAPPAKAQGASAGTIQATPQS